MSNPKPLILIAGKTICGPGTPLETVQNVRDQTFTLPNPGGREIKGIVLSSNVPVSDIRDYFSAFLFQSDGVTPKKYPLPNGSRVCTLISRHDHWHHILMEQENVKRLYLALANGTFPLKSPDFLQSAHYIYFNRRGVSVRAVVFFNSEKFVTFLPPSDEHSLLNLGQSTTHVIGFHSMCRLGSARPKLFSETSYFRNAIHVNTSSSCFMSRMMDALVICMGKQICATTDFIVAFTDDQKTAFKAAFNAFPENIKTRTRELLELFTDISNWIRFVSSVLEDSRFVDIKVLKHLIMCNPISRCARGFHAQEDALDVLIRVMGLFMEYHDYLRQISTDELYRFLRSSVGDPANHFCSSVSVDYVCGACGRRAENFYAAAHNKPYIIRPYLHRCTDQRSVDLSINSLVSQFFDIGCNNRNCRAENGSRKKLLMRDIRRCRAHDMPVNTKQIITVHKNSSPDGSNHGRCYIPEKFTVGNNILEWNYVILNHSNSDLGESGHYTGIWRHEGHFFFMDDGSAPIPISRECVNNASEHAYLFVCTVVGHLSDVESREFLAAVDHAQMNEYNEIFVEFTANSLIKARSLMGVAQRKLDELDVSMSAENRASAVQAIQNAQAKLVEIEFSIAAYNDTTPEDDRALMVESFARQVTDLRETANGFNTRIALQ